MNIRAATILSIGLGVICILASCGGFIGTGISGVGINLNPILFNNQINQRDDDENYLIQQYDRYSDKDKSSEYAVNRKIEFEFFKGDRSTTNYVTTRLLSSTAEPDVDGKLLILIDQRDVVLLPESFYTKPYTDQVSYTSTTPTTSYKTVTHPGGVDVVHNPDGTVEHVHRPPTTETITVQDKQTNTYTSQQEVTFNTGTYAINTRALRDINRYALFDFGILIGQDTVFVYPSERQIARLQDFLNR